MTTPRTNAAFEGDISVGLQPEIKTWEEAKDFARQLETELIALQRWKEELWDNKKQQWLNSVTTVCADFSNVADYISQIEKERDQLLATVEGLKQAGEMLWIVVANVSEGNWDKQSKEWQEAAARWRDNYFNNLQSIPPTNLVKRSVLEKVVEWVSFLKARLDRDEAFQMIVVSIDKELDKALKEAHEKLQRTK